MSVFIHAEESVKICFYYGSLRILAIFVHVDISDKPALSQPTQVLKHLLGILISYHNRNLPFNRRAAQYRSCSYHAEIGRSRTCYVNGAAEVRRNRPHYVEVL